MALSQVLIVRLAIVEPIHLDSIQNLLASIELVLELRHLVDLCFVSRGLHERLHVIHVRT